ncbi:hypothetical protein [Brevundimonas sp.]|uniref:hypothetical protein n=1 Tax=Brevundimonas sp. TaxID=1871086 RepID=UPI003BA9D0D3
MSRIMALGLAAIVLAAWGPADQKLAAKPATPEASAMTPVAAAEPAAAPQAAAPMSWEDTQERYRNVEAEPADPLEALEYRGVLCQHYSGEIGGDGSERDQWLNARMDELRCEPELVAEARALRAAHKGQADIVSRLDAVIAVYEP